MERKPQMVVVSTSDYNGIQLPALVTAPLLSRKKMQGWNVERSPLRHPIEQLADAPKK